MKNKKKFFLYGAIPVLVALMVLVLVIINQTEKEDVSYPPDVVVLQDGSIISLSHYFNNGYWKGSNEMLLYLQKQNLLRKDTTITIHMEVLIETSHKSAKDFFDNDNLKNK